MSGPAPASTSSSTLQLPTKSTWARGPSKQNSASTTPHTQSPAPPTPVSSNPSNFHATYSRRPSALAQRVSVKDGVGVPLELGPPITFGSIDDAVAPISSSPAAAPAVKPVNVVRSFGSVAAQNGGSDTAKSAVTSRPPPILATPTSSSQVAPVLPPTSAQSAVSKIDRKSIAKLFQGPSI